MPRDYRSRPSAMHAGATLHVQQRPVSIATACHAPRGPVGLQVMDEQAFQEEVFRLRDREYRSGASTQI